jgi:poly-gamma-glutamate capsule biosynthesis protein CapA/YwtB (metallophosphatase superfamily)
MILTACSSDTGQSPTRTSATTAATATRETAPPSPTPQPAPTVQTPTTSITISAVGDISLAREVVTRMEADGAGYPYALIAHLLDADINIANLEGALTERGDPWPKGYNFRTPPRFAIGLRDAGFDLVSLANNHTMDYGAVGLFDTFGVLDASNSYVRRIGAGGNIANASAPAIIEANGLRVAFIGCADTPTEGGGFAIRDWAATADAPGLFICDDEPLAAAIADARARADFVIVVAHAGDEYRSAPNATQRRIAETALAAGADAYIGHHAHVVQPVEQRGGPHGGQVIAWGLGNFIFDLDEVDLANIPAPRVSLILNLTLTKGAGVTSFEAIPVTQDANEDRPRPATPEEAAVLQELVTP